MQIKGLQRKTIASILKQRKIEKFHSLEDFLVRTGVSATEAETLIRCGACDGWGRSRPEMIWDYEISFKTRDQKQRSLLLFESETPSHIMLSDYTQQDKLLHELECLDIMTSEHILSLFGIRYENNRLCSHELGSLVPARDIANRLGKLVTIAGWLITYKRIQTVKGELMKFITLEDQTGLVEVILFPKVYKKWGHVLQDRGPFVVKGKVAQEEGCFTVIALWVGRIRNSA